MARLMTVQRHVIELHHHRELWQPDGIRSTRGESMFLA